MRDLFTLPEHRAMAVYLVLMLLIGVPALYFLNMWGFAVLIVFTLVYWFGLSILDMLRGKGGNE